MIYRLMIFLMLCGIAAADIFCLVGGSSASITNAGWCTSTVALADTFLAGGAPVESNAGGVVDNNGGNVRITDTGEFVDALEDMYVYVDFTSNVHVDGRYRIITQTGNAITLDLTYIGVENVTLWSVGGAVLATYNAVSYDLEDVLDDSIGDAASNDVLILIYLASAQEITEQIMVDSNGGSGAFRKSLIGVNSSYAALSNGSYTEYINTNNTPTGIDIFEISVENITFENIAATNPGGSGQPDSGDLCFNITGTGHEFVARNCRAINGYYGFYSLGRSSALVDCIVYDNRLAQVNFAVHGASIIGGYFEFNRTKSYTGTNNLEFGGIGAKVVGATIVGNATGIYLSTYGSHLVLNCNFRDQTTQAIVVNHANATLLCFNNIMKLADSANDKGITLTLGSMYEDYNITNATSANSGFTGTNSVDGLALSDTSPWTDATADNFKLDRTDGLIANALEAGWSPYSIAGIMGKQSIGAFPTYDLPAKTSVIAPDTVYGIEGTGSGNGGGGQPIIGGSVIR